MICWTCWTWWNRLRLLGLLGCLMPRNGRCRHAGIQLAPPVPIPPLPHRTRLYSTRLEKKKKKKKHRVGGGHVLQSETYSGPWNAAARCDKEAQVAQETVSGSGQARRERQPSNQRRWRPWGASSAAQYLSPLDPADGSGRFLVSSFRGAGTGACVHVCMCLSLFLYRCCCCRRRHIVVLCARRQLPHVIG